MIGIQQTMEKFNLVIDEKVTIWRRTYCTVSEETLEDAVKRASELDYDECLDSQMLYETEEVMLPEYNGNNSTIEVHSDDLGTLLYSNECSESL